MSKALRAIWTGITDAYGELFSVVGMNVLWFLLSVPIGFAESLLVLGWVGAAPVDTGDSRTLMIALLSTLLVVVLTLGPNPASAGMHFWANRLARDERLEFSLFWEGLRTFWWPALKLMAISHVGFFLLLVNALFYIRSDAAVLQAFGMVWLYATYFWLSMQLYQMPLLMEQEVRRVRLVLRNSFFLALREFLPTFILVVVLTFLVIVSMFVALLLVMLIGGLAAIISARALHSLLERYRPTANQSATADTPPA